MCLIVWVEMYWLDGKYVVMIVGKVDLCVFVNFIDEVCEIWIEKWIIVDWMGILQSCVNLLLFFGQVFWMIKCVFYGKCFLDNYIFLLFVKDILSYVLGCIVVEIFRLEIVLELFFYVWFGLCLGIMIKCEQDCISVFDQVLEWYKFDRCLLWG